MSRTWLRPWWPLPAWSLLVPTAAVFGVVLLGTWHMLAWPYQEWVRTSAQFHQQSAWAAPLAAASAAYAAGRLSPPSRVFATPTVASAGSRATLRQISVLWVLLLTGYVGGLIPLIVVTVGAAEYGGPDLLVMVSGLVAMAAAVGIGYLIGVIGRTSLAAPVAFLLLFAVTVLGGAGEDRYAAVVPVLYLEPMLGQEENRIMVAFRCVLFLTVAAVAAMMAAWIVRSFWTRRGAPLVASAACGAVPLILVVIGLGAQPALFTVPSRPPTTCVDRHDIEFCVHAGHASQLEPVVDELGPVLDAYGKPPDAIARIYDRALLLNRNSLSESTLHVDIEPQLASSRQESPTHDAQIGRAHV